MMDDEDNPEGVPHEVLGGVHPVEVVSETRAPPAENRACMRDFCPAVNIFIQASSV